jgi:hypothetical protein
LLNAFYSNSSFLLQQFADSPANFYTSRTYVSIEAYLSARNWSDIPIDSSSSGIMRRGVQGREWLVVQNVTVYIQFPVRPFFFFRRFAFFFFFFFFLRWVLTFKFRNVPRQEEEGTQVWLLTLIITIILLSASLLTSVAMHCWLYRRRQRTLRLAAMLGSRGGAGGKKRVLDKTQLGMLVVCVHPARPGDPPPVVVSPTEPGAESSAAADEDEEGDLCAICLDGYSRGDEVRYMTGFCTHRFHSACVEQWLCQTEASCPVCKVVLFPESDDEGDAASPAEDGADAERGERRGRRGDDAGGDDVEMSVLGGGAPRNPGADGQAANVLSSSTCLVPPTDQDSHQESPLHDAEVPSSSTCLVPPTSAPAPASSQEPETSAIVAEEAGKSE